MKLDWIKATVILRHREKVEAAKEKLELERIEREMGRYADSASESEPDYDDDWQVSCMIV